MKQYTNQELEGMSKDELLKHAIDVRNRMNEIIHILQIKSD